MAAAGSGGDPEGRPGRLVRVAANEAKKSLKNRGWRIVMESLSVSPGARRQRTETGIDAMQLRKALGASTPTIVRSGQRYAAGFNATELAEAIGITPSGVRTRLDRLTARLRQELSDDELPRLERQIAAEDRPEAGPPLPVDAALITRLAGTRTSGWSFRGEVSRSQVRHRGVLALATGVAAVMVQLSRQENVTIPAADTGASILVLQDGDGRLPCSAA